MKTNYQTPKTTCIEIQSSVLCASGTQTATTGYIPPIGKGNGSW